MPARSRLARWLLSLAAAIAVAFVPGPSRARADGPPKRLAPAAPTPCGKTRLVLFTDSHGLTDFGGFLEHRLRAVPDAELASFTLGGSSPGWLIAGKTSPRAYFYTSCSAQPPAARSKLVHKKLRGPPLGELLRAGQPLYERQVVLLAYGSNVPGFLDAYRGSVEEVVRLVRATPRADCIWIGPPEMRKRSPKWVESVYGAIREGIRAASDGGPAACMLVDSRRHAHYPAKGGDGIHYPFSPAGAAAVEAWTDGVAHDIAPILRSPADAGAAAAFLARIETQSLKCRPQ